jgi:hypothetical protein
MLSGLLFPGLGQIYLKHYRRGLAVAVTTMICIAVIVLRVVRVALVILNRIQAEGGEIDMGAVINAAHQASAASSSRLINPALLLLILCWIGSTVDAYRIGKLLDATIRS